MLALCMLWKAPRVLALRAHSEGFLQEAFSDSILPELILVVKPARNSHLPKVEETKLRMP